MKNLVTINDQDQAVAEYLKDQRVVYTVRFKGTEKSDNWERDQFVVTFKIGNNSESFEYGCGLGHRLQVARNSYKLSESQLSGVKKLRDLIGESRLDTTVIDLGGKIYAVKPTQASVLYCLFSDADCGSESFDDFCDNFGYNAGSMKDFRTYQACMDTAKKIRKIFTSEQRAKLAELLQDY